MTTRAQHLIRILIWLIVLQLMGAVGVLLTSHKLTLSSAPDPQQPPTPSVTPAPDTPLPTAPRLRVVVLTGGHGFDEREFPKLFDGHPAAEYTFAEQRDDSELFEDISEWPYDVIVLYNMGQRISEKRRQNFLTLLKNGVGLVALHHSVGAYREWREFGRIIGADYFLQATTIDGVEHPASTYKHDVDFELHIQDSKHPITKGLDDFIVHDETYNDMIHYPRSQVLITTDHPTSATPICWVRAYEQARVCHIQVGHGPQVFTDENYRRLVHNAIEWTVSNAFPPPTSSPKSH